MARSCNPLTAIFTALLLAGQALAQSSPTTNRAQSPVLRLDAALDALLSEHTMLRTLYQQSDGFFEGPTWLGGRDGFVVFSDIPGNRILKIDRGGRIRIFLAKVLVGPAPHAIHDTLYTNRELVGSNGTLAVGNSKLLIAIFGGDTIDEFDWRSGVRRTLGWGAREPTFDRANDLALAPGGDVYFSAEGGIFHLHAGGVTLFRAMAANGLAFSPDGASLYATDGPTRIIKIAMNRDGTAGDIQLFIDTHGDPGNDEFLDGLKVDRAGNVWAVAPGGLWIMNPAAKVLGRIVAPSVTMPTGVHRRFTNLAFGGSNGDTLFMTAPGGVYSLQLARPAIKVAP